MPICAGGELLDRIKSKQKFTEHEAGVMFKKLVGAIKFLHEKQIVHRDLKVRRVPWKGRALRCNNGLFWEVPTSVVYSAVVWSLHAPSVGICLNCAVYARR